MYELKLVPFKAMLDFPGADKGCCHAVLLCDGAAVVPAADEDV